MTHRRARRLRGAGLCLLLAAAVGGPACRPRTPDHAAALRFLDRLTAAEVVESPLKSPDETGRTDLFPSGSLELPGKRRGHNIYGLRRTANAGGTEMEILFAPPRSVFSFPLPASSAGVLDFGIGIIRNSAAKTPAGTGPEASAGVAFLVALESETGRTILFESILPPPPAATKRTINRSRHRIPLPARDEETVLTFETTGPDSEMAFWANPVFYTPQSKPAGVILISLDTLRPDHLGLYGYDRPVSPALDALAADAAVFENAYSTAAWTLPAHVSMLSGLNCNRHKVYDEQARVDPATATLAEKLREAGYATRAFTGGGLVSAEYGLAQGFDEYRMESGGHQEPNQAGIISREAVRWLEENADRPYFLFLHTYQIHLPYKSPEPWVSRFLAPDARWKSFSLEKHLGGLAGVFRPLSEPDRANVIALYDADIQYTDDMLIKPVVYALRRLGLYDRATIVVTSDHGEEFFDHGGWDHTHSAHEELIRIPLIVKMPGSEFRGRRLSPIVRITDIMPTVLEAAGVPWSGPPLDGAALQPIMRGEETADRTFLVELSDNVYNCRIPPRLATNDGRRKIILNQPFRPDQMNFFLAPPPDFPALQIFDLNRDPREMRNLAGRTEEAARDRALLEKARRLERLIPPRGDKKIEIDQDLKDQLRALGYVK